MSLHRWNRVSVIDQALGRLIHGMPENIVLKNGRSLIAKNKIIKK